MIPKPWYMPHLGSVNYFVARVGHFMVRLQWQEYPGYWNVDWEECCNYSNAVKGNFTLADQKDHQKPPFQEAVDYVQRRLEDCVRDVQGEAQRRVDVLNTFIKGLK